MLDYLKQLLKRIIPPSIDMYVHGNHQIKTELYSLQEQCDRVLEENRRLESNINQVISLLEENRRLESNNINQVLSLLKESNENTILINERIDLVNHVIDDQRMNYEKTQQEVSSLSEHLNEIDAVLQQLINTTQQNLSIEKEIKRSSNEIIWANVFDSTIRDSSWLGNVSFSPGRWAVGYGYLYVMYRVLNECRPKSILELGLGQSTRMISQYVKNCNDAHHYVVEHDPNWIAFFENNYQLSPQSKIVQLDRTFIPYKDADQVRVFDKFSDSFKNMKFDYICIDAPLSGDMKKYGRIDVLSILPDCLSDTFVIMLDDCERCGEKGTSNEIDRILTENSIEFVKGYYSANKDFRIWCSKQLAFLTTL